MSLEESPVPTFEPLMGLASLMRRAFVGEDLTPVGAKLIARAMADTGDAEALMDLSTVLHLTGNPKLAVSVQAQALETRQVFHLPAATGKTGLTLLALMAPGDLTANTPREALVENSDIAVEMLFLIPGQPLPDTVPDHDVALVAMSESDANRELLKELESVAPFWPRPLLNRPERIAQLSRDGAARRLRGVPGVLMPITVRVNRDTLVKAGKGELKVADFLEDGDFPLIVRPVDSHAGHDLDRIDDAPALAAYLGTLATDSFYVAPFIDYKSADGLYRKFRIVLMRGEPYAGHMAISSHWMIHYLNAGMADSPEKRDEEARFMANFDTDFAVRHREALAEIHGRLGLDYLGIDCGETADGKLLIFEVDHAMIVHGMDPVDLYPYKQPQMAKVFTAFRQMLEDSRNTVLGR